MGPRSLVSIFDITERKRSQEALDRAQADLAHVNRVSTLGELAASIAHEVNQPIAGVVTNADAALRWLARCPPDFQEVQQALDGIVNDGKRAGKILGRIRALVKKAPVQRERLDINQVILEVVALTRSEVQRNGITLLTELEPALPPVLGDRIQLQQVVLNFILNAIEATSGVDEYRRNVVISTAKDSNDAIVAVRDSGVGIPVAEQDKIWDRLYRGDKSRSQRGLGLGLSLVRAIIRAHEGQVQVVSQPEQGAEFIVTIPVGEATGKA